MNMKKNFNNRILPVGLKGDAINERMKELMGIAPINENRKTSVVELTKIGPDGNPYAIVRENHEYYIKTTTKKENLVDEDFTYIGGLKNKKSEAYPSYAKAIKHLNLKFNSLKEAYNIEGDFNIFENDNLVNEAGVAGFSNMTGNGFSGEGNLDDNQKLEVENEGVTLTEIEKNVDDMCDDVKNPGKYVGKEKNKKGLDDDGDGVPNGADKKPKDGAIKESRKLSITRAIKEMDSIIDNLTEGTVKKKVYTIK